MQASRVCRALAAAAVAAAVLQARAAGSATAGTCAADAPPAEHAAPAAATAAAREGAAEAAHGAGLELLQRHQEGLAAWPTGRQAARAAVSRIAKELAAAAAPSPPPLLLPNEGVDARGRPCTFCSLPPPERTNRSYEQRQDCGNQTLALHPDNLLKPIISFSRPASESGPATNGFCELNERKSCADAIVNRDFLLMGKSIMYQRWYSWDKAYCILNGFLEPDVVAVHRDFDGTAAKALQLCEKKYSVYSWNSTLTLAETARLAELKPSRVEGMFDGVPTLPAAEVVAASRCAMGSLGCDLAYCAYTFCNLGYGNIGTYDECPGWDPVEGMPLP